MHLAGLHCYMHYTVICCCVYVCTPCDICCCWTLIVLINVVHRSNHDISPLNKQQNRDATVHFFNNYNNKKKSCKWQDNVPTYIPYSFYPIKETPSAHPHLYRQQQITLVLRIKRCPFNELSPVSPNSKGNSFLLENFKQCLMPLNNKHGSH